MSLTVPLTRVARRLFNAAAPKARYFTWETDTAAAFPYAGLNKHYREYRRDTLVRNCINTLAGFSTSKGFETALEVADAEGLTLEEQTRELQRREYVDVKVAVDRVNAAVNLDHVCYVAVVKAKVHGHAGFEVVLDEKQAPRMLLPLRSEDLEPYLNEDWMLEYYKYKGLPKYQPQELLYFTNNALEADYQGLSDIEPCFDALNTRRIILQEAFKEAAKILWAGVGIHRVNTKGLSDSEATAAITAIRDAIKPGKHIVVNQDVESRIVNLDPNLAELVQALEALEADVIGNFKVPRFLIGREKQFNRATAFAEAQLFIQGPIADIQRWLRRELEAQWYPRLVRLFLRLGPDDAAPIRVKHRWKPITISDFTELAGVVAQLYAQGQGVITKQKAHELLGFDPTEILREESNPGNR